MRSPCLGISGVVPDIGSLYTYIDDCEQIGYRLRLLHVNLINNFDIADHVVEDIDDIDILDIWDSVPDIAEIFHVVLETLIMLLSDGLQGFYYRWTLIRALEVFNEHDT
jgi:hypothetical protein